MKFENKLLFWIIEIWIILAVVFAIYDLDISKAIVDTKSPWGVFGTNIGFHVRDALLFIVSLILIGSFFNKKVQRKIGYFALVISFLNLIYYNLDSTQESMMAPITLIIFNVSFIVLTFNKDWRNYMKIAIMVLLLYLSLSVILDITKVLFGRVRFKDLSSNYTEYTQWYIINGPNSDNQSFPSGHSAYAWLFLPFLILIKNEKMKIPVKIILIASVIGYGLFISLSRIIIGGHYCSDILFSTGIASVLTILFYKKIYPLEIQQIEKVILKERIKFVDSETFNIKNSYLSQKDRLINNTKEGQYSQDWIESKKKAETIS